MSPRSQEIKRNMVFIKIQILWAADSPHADKQPTGTEKSLASDVPNEGLVSKLCKELWQLNNNKINILILKWAQRWICIYPKNLFKFPFTHRKFSTSIANGGNANRSPNETGQTPHPLGWPSSQRCGKCWARWERGGFFRRSNTKLWTAKGLGIYTLGKWDHVSTQNCKNVPPPRAETKCLSFDTDG